MKARAAQACLLASMQVKNAHFLDYGSLFEVGLTVFLLVFC